MKNMFSYDSPAISALNKAADLILVNLLFLVTCLPVITIGAAQSALFAVAFRWAEREDTGVKKYWAAFRSNVRGSLLPWSIMLAAGAALAFNFFITLRNDMPFRGVFLAVCILLALSYFLVFSQLFPFFARFNCTVRQLFGNALLTALAHPLRTVVIIALDVFPWVMLLCFTETFMTLTPLWLVAYASLRGYLTALLMRAPYRRYEEQLKD